MTNPAFPPLVSIAVARSRPHPATAEILGKARLDDDGLTYLALLLTRDQAPHEADQVLVEDRVEHAIVDAPRPSVHDPHVFKSRLL